jgi:serine-type D-Ala-D-Ala carboxypeptidase (penicillin-binding protein 5/6)
MNRLVAVLAALFLALPGSYAASKTKKSTSSSKKPAATRVESPGIARPFAVPNEDDANVFPYIKAPSVLLCDAVTGRVLYEKNADDVRAVASTQKLLAALLVAEEGDLDSKITVHASDGYCEPTKLGLRGGEVYKRYDLLKLLLVKSMNDVARCLARDNAGSVAAFAAKMNAKAREIGMRQSNFVNPNGLTEPGQYSTARDMARLALHAYRNRVLRSIMGTRVMSFRTASGKTLTYENTNKLMKSFGLCNGMKTGYTSAAGHCLVSSAADGGRHLVCVVLGTQKREDIWTDSYKLLNWGFNQLKAEPVATAGAQ